MKNVLVVVVFVVFCLFVLFHQKSVVTLIRGNLGSLFWTARSYGTRDGQDFNIALKHPK